MKLLGTFTINYDRHASLQLDNGKVITRKINHNNTVRINNNFHVVSDIEKAASFSHKLTD